MLAGTPHGRVDVVDPTAVRGRAKRARGAHSRRLCCGSCTLAHTQQYNDLRENKFKEWKFNNKTWFPIVLMSAILPVACYKMTKAELVRRSHCSAVATRSRSVPVLTSRMPPCCCAMV